MRTNIPLFLDRSLLSHERLSRTAVLTTVSTIKKVQYKEVAALLRGCGIDLDHNRFLILQVGGA